jgi:DeoR/GlpR family transcriptional regulator of sugar metabolism
VDGGRNLLAGQRRALILDELRGRGGVRVSELTALLGVSDMTVRRDLDALARQGALRKVHGGAVPVGHGPAHEPGFAAKTELEPDAKRRIARAAAALAEPGGTVALSGGTTTAAVARELPAVPDLTVVTNSVRVADVLHAAPQPSGGRRATVVLTGGVRTPSDALVGPVADRAIGSLRFDVLFLGVHGLGAHGLGRPGLSTPNLAEAETNRHFIRSARRVVVVADHTKWEATGLSSFAVFAQVNVLVSDAPPPPAARAELAAAGTELLVAP